MDDFEKSLEEYLQDPEFRREWETSEVQYQIAGALISARIEADITQEELAERSGVRHSVISRIENGNCMPSMKTLKALANGLGKKLVISFQQDGCNSKLEKAGIALKADAEMKNGNYMPGKEFWS